MFGDITSLGPSDTYMHQLASNDSDNDLLPVRPQAIILTEPMIAFC